jgi:3-dehydroquinate synthase
VYDQLLPARLERSTPILALGGGVIGDMSGFVAATLLRGVPFVQIPTTLLAMVDASVGGKTGINHSAGKNLIGAFHQPMAVFCDPQVLRTLPPRDFRGGLAECIKHDLIRDAEGFATLEHRLQPDPQAMSIDDLAELVAHNVRIKAQVVAADPFERGERAHLNFGHTFGHAIESVSRYGYSHGESVALGMVAAAHLSRALGLLDASSVDRIARAIARAGLPTTGLTLATEALLATMQTDKKVVGGRLRFVVLDRIGNAVVREEVPPELVIRALDQLRG